METIRIQYVFTEAEGVEATLELRRLINPLAYPDRRIGALMLLPLPIVCLMPTEVTGMGVSNPVTWLTVLLPTLVGACILLFPLWTKLFAKWVFRRNLDANKTIFWEFSKNELRNSTDVVQSSFNWTRVVQAHETQTHLALFVESNRAFILPKSAFQRPEDLETMRGFIRLNDIPFSGAFSR